MTAHEIGERLSRRLIEAGIADVRPQQLASLAAYFQLLARWNRRMNLTALPLEPPSDETWDRLFVEPLAAAHLFAPSHVVWFDIGSGGGSPAIPLKILRPNARLTMVESRARKAAFLREAVRTLGLSDATVAHARAETMPEKTADIVTVRAVLPDAQLGKTLGTLVKTGGKLIFFHGTRPFELDGWRTISTTKTIGQGHVSVLEPSRADVPRGTR